MNIKGSAGHCLVNMVKLVWISTKSASEKEEKFILLYKKIGNPLYGHDHPSEHTTPTEVPDVKCMTIMMIMPFMDVWSLKNFLSVQPC